MSDSNLAIKVHSLSKSFDLPEERISSLKQFFVRLGRGGSKRRQQVLKGVEFEVKQGEFLGIVGRNGSGKSTLLKLLAGVYTPTSGAVEVHGKMAPFIELGVGFNPELTGRDNVFLNGALLGFSHKEMEAMYDSIVEFSELGPFMDRKLKNYSSGMQVRLAFSIAIKAKSEILLIDEVLAVGDANFQKKCMEVFEHLKQDGRTIVFVTHSMDSVREFCDRVILINKGEILVDGDPEKAIDIYNKLNFEDESKRAEDQNDTREIERFGNGHARIEMYRFVDGSGRQTIKLAAGKPFRVEAAIRFFEKVKNPAIGIMFRKDPHQNLFGINNFYENTSFGPQSSGDTLRVTAEGVMPLAPGVYYVSFSVADVRSASNYAELDNLNNVLKVTISGRRRWGMLAADTKMEAKKL